MAVISFGESRWKALSIESLLCRRNINMKFFLRCAQKICCAAVFLSNTLTSIVSALRTLFKRLPCSLKSTNIQDYQPPFPYSLRREEIFLSSETCMIFAADFFRFDLGLPAFQSLRHVSERRNIPLFTILISSIFPNE